jgi:hypothetical protein
MERRHGRDEDGADGGVLGWRRDGRLGRRVAAAEELRARLDEGAGGLVVVEKGLLLFGLGVAGKKRGARA